MNSRAIFNYTLAFFLVLTIVAYFLAKNGKVNNFPTFVVSLMVLYLVLSDHQLRGLLVQSRILQSSSLLLIYLALSSCWSEHVEWIGVAKAFANVPLLLAFIIGIFVCDKTVTGFTSMLVRILVLSALVSALYSTYLAIEIGYQPYHEDRMYALGRLGNPIIGALSYGIACVFAVNIMLQTSDRIKRTGWLSGILILFYAIFLTGSVGIWIGLLLSMIVIYALHYRRTLKQTLIRLFVISGMGILVLTGIYCLFPEFFVSLFPRAFSYRPEIWSVAISRALEHNPWFGFGSLDSGNLIIGTQEFYHPHSIYFSNFYYGGLIGLLLLLYLIGNALNRATQSAFNSNQVNGSESDKMCFHPAGSGFDNGINLAHMCLSSLVYSTIVFALDGDRVLDNVGLIWIAFWLPISLCVIIEIYGQESITVFTPGD